MGITYEDAVKAQTELEDQILPDHNVVSIGVIAETNEIGEPTGDYAIQVGVISIDVYSRAQIHGQSSIPREFLIHSKNGKEEVKHIHISVVREGKIEALTNFSLHEKEIPSAKDARFSTKINYSMGLLTSRNQIRTTSMTKGGDSGSCLIEKGTKNPVGLLFAGSDTASYCNPMRGVLSTLSMEHANKYPSGKVHTFAKDYPLSILKRPYSISSFTTYKLKTLKPLSTSFKAPLPLIKCGAIAFSLGIFASCKLGNTNNFKPSETSHFPGVAKKR